MQNYSTDILIIGSGPAGLSAAIYAARSGKKTLVLEGARAASRLSLGYELENYPGFISINSNDLLARFRDQARNFGAEFVKGDTLALSLTMSHKYVSTTDSFIEARAVVLATGKPFAKNRQIPGEERLLGYGVSYCAVCDGPLYKGRDVAAYGHTPEAVEDVWILHQTGVRVHWIPGKPKDPAALEKDLTKAEKFGIPVYGDAEIKEIAGDKNVERVVLNTSAGEQSLDAAACFIFREVPTGPLFEKSGLVMDHKQCLAIDRFQRTNLEGVFAAGDVTCGGLQVVSAAGEGCVAALQALAYLRK
ncbi:MAG: FAD-dependent oxidoreductase [Candidatus Aminicenantes bacterium]|nr:FAD-dependent oxidoreductase [Candidatus Aminicenantes bacterium]